MPEEKLLVQSIVGPVHRSVFRPFGNLFFVAILAAAMLMSASFFLDPLRMFRHHFLEYARIIWFPLLLGFSIGGLIEVYVPRPYIVKILSNDSPKTIFAATALGFIFSGCSHGCLAISMQLYKKGASAASVIAFLLASPWANLSVTLLLIGFFGSRGLLVVFAALVISLVTGTIYIFLGNKNLIEKNPNALQAVEAEGDFSILTDLRQKWRGYQFSFKRVVWEEAPLVFSGAWHLAQMVLGWILIGMLLASLIGSFVPAHIFYEWMGKNFSGMLATLGLATVIEICSEGTAPLAFEIYRQTNAFGNTFIFLMAGVVTDYTEVGLLWSQIGKKTALWLLAIAVPLTLLFGFLFNVLF